jgi:hypothetical protein
VIRRNLICQVKTLLVLQPLPVSAWIDLRKMILMILACLCPIMFGNPMRNSQPGHNQKHFIYHESTKNKLPVSQDKNNNCNK